MTLHGHMLASLTELIVPASWWNSRFSRKSLTLSSLLSASFFIKGFHCWIGFFVHGPSLEHIHQLPLAPVHHSLPLPSCSINSISQSLPLPTQHAGGTSSKHFSQRPCIKILLISFIIQYKFKGCGFSFAF